MKKIEIANLIEVIKLQYPHICINYMDFDLLLMMPNQRRNFYPFHDSKSRNVRKRGAFNNGQTICWEDYNLESGFIKLSLQIPKKITDKVWLDKQSLKEEDSPMKIYKLMKMKAFW
jgi:hypothetical protein